MGIKGLAATARRRGGRITAAALVSAWCVSMMPSVAAAVPDANYPPAAPAAGVATNLAPCGAEVSTSGTGWKPGSVVKIELRSAPAPLATPLTDSGGAFHATFLVPDTTPGPHDLSFTGTDPAGRASVITGTFTVVATSAPSSVCSSAQVLGTQETREVASPPAAAPSATAPSASALSFTGAPALAALVALSAALIVAGTLAVIATRRRRYGAS